MKVHNISFSAHADSKGIIDLFKQVEAENIMFVHGDKQRMLEFGSVIRNMLKVNVYTPPNFELTKIQINEGQELAKIFIDQDLFQYCKLNINNEIFLENQDKSLVLL